MASSVRDIPVRAAWDHAFWQKLRNVLSEAKASGNLTTWLGILLSCLITLATVFITVGQVLSRLDSLKDSIAQQDKLQIERDSNQAGRIAEMERRLTKAEEDNSKLKDRLTSTRELVIASGGKLIPREKEEEK